MYVVDVIPFSRTAPAGTLSYRSRDLLAEGTIVEVSLRRKIVQGLVVGCQSVAEAKATLKTASFMLTKTVPHIAGTLPDMLRTAALSTAEYHAATLGSTLASLFGEHIRSDLSLVDAEEMPLGDGFHIEAVEDSFESRAQAYERFIASNTKEDRATLLVVPTIAETEFWKDRFSKEKPLVLSSVLTGKRREAALAASVTATRLIISTPSFSWTPIRSLGSIIIERAGAGAYRIPKRPYLDMRVALRALAEARALTLVYGDHPLPLEYRPHPVVALRTLAGSVTILDARREKPEEGSQAAQQAVDEPWSAIPPVMRDAIGYAVGAGGHALVLAVRKGYAPSVVCRDCGTTRTDEFGNVLTFSKEGGRVFRTVDGTMIEQADVTCAVCGSWNLMPLGIGVERVEEELRAAFPDSTVIHFEGDTVRTLASATKALLQAREPGSIIVGTEAALPWLLAAKLFPFSIAAVPSADSLLALPFWRSRERFVRLGLLLASMSERLILGTRMPDDTAVSAIKDAESGFFAEETGLRKALSYPPFGTLLVLQAEGTKAQLEQLDRAISIALGSHTTTILPERALTRTVLRRSYVLRLPQDSWPDPVLAGALQQLPPSVRVLIDPESF